MERYGQHGAQTVLYGGVASRLFFGGMDIDTAQELSRTIAETTIDRVDAWGNTRSEREHLLSPAALRAMPDDQVLYQKRPGGRFAGLVGFVQIVKSERTFPAASASTTQRGRFPWPVQSPALWSWATRSRSNAARCSTPRRTIWADGPSACTSGAWWTRCKGSARALLWLPLRQLALPAPRKGFQDCPLRSRSLEISLASTSSSRSPHGRGVF